MHEYQVWGRCWMYANKCFHVSTTSHNKMIHPPVTVVSNAIAKESEQTEAPEIEMTKSTTIDNDRQEYRCVSGSGAQV